jgi:hypothetical protein
MSARGVPNVEVEPLQGVQDWISLARYLEGVVPKGVAVRIRARASSVSIESPL